MPFTNEEVDRRKRIKLFKEMDLDDNGLLHINESVRAFFRRIPTIRGIMDTRPVWTQCFRRAREAVKPVVPIGIDFMEQAQFRVYLMTLWIYLKLWECLWRSCQRGAAVEVQPCNVQLVVQVLAEFGHDDTEDLESFLLAHLQSRPCETIPFQEFVDICLKKVLPGLAQIEEEYEYDNAVTQLRKIQPALLAKQDQIGYHKVQSLESLQHRMTGFAVRNVKKAAANLPPTGVAKGNGLQQWTSQYAMMHTATKFSPEAQLNPDSHPCKTDRRVPAHLLARKSYSAVDLHWDSSKRKPLNLAGNTILQSPQGRGIAPARFLPYQPLGKV